MNMNELRKCPFCGEEPDAYWKCGCLTDGKPCNDKGGDILNAVQCHCGAENATIKAWNTRPIEDRLVEALKKIVELANMDAIASIEGLAKQVLKDCEPCKSK